jgi:hypothetical protein
MILKTEGDYLEANIEIDGCQLTVMDDFEGSRLAPATLIELELHAFISDPGDWDTVINRVDAS